ncbi:DUF3307 domain-containing protein [Nonlabens ulvanivorans]|uniref:Uncharacterized protein DUF3307 n=2 Tax=Nonlabens ulvanivorans TaxID=906888 RepID=A0A084K0E4_NONUL|nr:DUF3307 domain-containing protein [Nonlabens ulvanivorans]KEZ94678.1 hypothetical protein IL45_00160 [Nonlabens ulvanivorans]PRX12110.1 uncharacterized protein DUF3307 [Nonlabens ulvanivorans]
MLLLIKLLIAHFLGDFILQTNSFTKKKEKHQLKSPHLYIHAIIHGLLALLFLNEIELWWAALIITITHLIIDAGKLKLTTKKNSRSLFLIDQLLHILVIFGLYLLIEQVDLINTFQLSEHTWLFILCSIFLTNPVGIMLKVFFTRWKLDEKDTGIDSLKNAGKWIGMIERLLVFIFIISGNFSAVGFLLTAKSVFRFGDLSKAKNMKLTEYVLIGTLLSFGIAILVGLLFNSLMI